MPSNATPAGSFSLSLSLSLVSIRRFMPAVPKDFITFVRSDASLPRGFPIPRVHLHNARDAFMMHKFAFLPVKRFYGSTLRARGGTPSRDFITSTVASCIVYLYPCAKFYFRCAGISISPVVRTAPRRRPCRSLSQTVELRGDTCRALDQREREREKEGEERRAMLISRGGEAAGV